MTPLVFLLASQAYAASTYRARAIWGLETAVDVVKAYGYEFPCEVDMPTYFSTVMSLLPGSITVISDDVCKKYIEDGGLCCDGVWDVGFDFRTVGITKFDWEGPVCTDKITCAKNKLINFPFPGGYLFPIAFGFLIFCCFWGCCCDFRCPWSKNKEPRKSFA